MNKIKQISCMGEGSPMKFIKKQNRKLYNKMGKRKKHIAFIVLAVALVILAGCRTNCGYSHMMWIKEKSKPENQVTEVVDNGDFKYAVTRDTVLGVTVKIKEVE